MRTHPELQTVFANSITQWHQAEVKLVCRNWSFLRENSTAQKNDTLFQQLLLLLILFSGCSSHRRHSTNSTKQRPVQDFENRGVKQKAQGLNHDHHGSFIVVGFINQVSPAHPHTRNSNQRTSNSIKRHENTSKPWGQRHCTEADRQQGLICVLIWLGIPLSFCILKYRQCARPYWIEGERMPSTVIFVFNLLIYYCCCATGYLKCLINYELSWAR